MARSSLLIREIDRLAREAKWTPARLADALGVTRSMLRYLRLGRQQPSRAVLGAILNTFGKAATVGDLVRYYLEVEQFEFAEDATAAKVCVGAEREGVFDDATDSRLRTFVAEVFHASLASGRGLYLFGADTATLGAALAFVGRACEKRGVRTLTLRADARLSMSQGETGLAVPLLLVERVDFLSEPIAALLAQRHAAWKPVVATSATTLDALPDRTAARLFHAAATIVPVAAAAPLKTSHPVHA